jgi:hypothetical protein
MAGHSNRANHGALAMHGPTAMSIGLFFLSRFFSFSISSPLIFDGLKKKRKIAFGLARMHPQSSPTPADRTRGLVIS